MCDSKESSKIVTECAQALCSDFVTDIADLIYEYTDNSTFTVPCANPDCKGLCRVNIVFDETDEKYLRAYGDVTFSSEDVEFVTETCNCQKYLRHMHLSVMEDTPDPRKYVSGAYARSNCKIVSVRCRYAYQLAKNWKCCKCRSPE